MTVGDYFMFTVSGLINSQVWQNVHFYRVTELDGSLEEGEFVDVVQEWADWYQDNIHFQLANVTSGATIWTGVEGENLFNEAAIGEVSYSPNLVGGETGDTLAQFNAYRFVTPSLRRGMNSGQRRFPGVLEAAVGEFGGLVGLYQAFLQAAADNMSADVVLTYGSGPKTVNIRPIIVKRVREGAGTLEDPYTYRLPRTLAEGVDYRANGWVAADFITTQNSRKTGRGI